VNNSPRFYFGLAVLCALAVTAVIFWPSTGPQPEKQRLATKPSKETVDVKHTVSAGQPPDFLKRMLNGEIGKLTPEQIENYVQSRGRDALSLVVASMLGDGGDKWLDEAAKRFPDDPRVAAALLIKRGGRPEAGEWIARLKNHDPGNSLGYLLAAKWALDGRDLDGAMKELSALDSTHMNDFRETWQSGITDAYHSAGYQGMEAEWMGMAQTPVVSGEVMKLSAGIAEAMVAAQERGDRTSAESLGRSGMKAAELVGGRGDRDLLINQLISVAMERKLLNQLHVFDFVPGDQRIVIERLAEMDKRIARIKSAIQSHTEMLPTLTEAELRQYTRRVQVEGELKAMEWLVAQRQTGR
jgi:hypothetical protein